MLYGLLVNIDKYLMSYFQQIKKMNLNPSKGSMQKSNHCLGTGSGKGSQMISNDAPANLNKESLATNNKQTTEKEITKEKPLLPEKVSCNNL